MLNGLTNINIELTSRCNKNCWMCGRRERERLYGDQNYGDMEFELLKKIATEIPTGISVQLHNNGESLLYDKLKEAIGLFSNCITSLVSNGKLLIERASDLIDTLDILSISIIENDTEEESEHQLQQLHSFLKLKGQSKPFTILRCVGHINKTKYKHLGLLMVDRTLHAPKGSVSYQNTPTIPEIGVCWDFLTRLAIDRFGNVSPCVRFDPDKELVLGNIQYETLDEIWNGKKRAEMKRMHCEGNRRLIKYCGNKCDYYGVPTK